MARDEASRKSVISVEQNNCISWAGLNGEEFPGPVLV